MEGLHIKKYPVRITLYLIGVILMEFSIYRMKQVLKGETDKRVSEEAAEALGEQMDEHGIDIASRAQKYAEEDGRKTVRAVDIKKALRE